ncbi:hypothetical protein [Caldimonas tepidiphila]|uniref:hypothetical protein n=1 Tax=Caldimonas tepidiphila TaxID=2315841 RepID=UPI001F0C95BB|nr:hypothetical protein [Caldimonas tepidiphila]
MTMNLQSVRVRHPWPVQPRTSGLLALALSSVLASEAAMAQVGADVGTPARSASPVEVGAVLDLAHTSRELALGNRDQGLALGHSEVTLGAKLGRNFAGRATAVAHSDEGKIEFEFEEAFVETTSLPRGLQLRGGRFLAQIGYLNELHLHTDDFVQRPLLYRAFLGNHYFDDGLRLNWVAPTGLYWRNGVEVFGGRKLVEESDSGSQLGAVVLSTKVGGDIDVSNSWQLGLSYLRNRRPAHAEEEEEHFGEAEHHEAHGAGYSGRHLTVIDGVWKWAPNGNNRERQLRLSAEYARVNGLAEAASSLAHRSGYVSAVYRFAPQWEAGIRADELRIREPHEDHVDSGKLQEVSAMLAWKPSHYSALRVQFSRQRDRGGFEDANRTVQVQYLMSFGAHGAHPF